LPNNTNRGYIKKAIEKAIKEICSKNNNISECIIESDSRNESGTPDLVNVIFAKIDQCDIFISDISIINSMEKTRKCPNPNVLIELGYACSRIGWEKVLCLYNSDYWKIEDLPFDIRSRKPIIYSTQNTIDLSQVLISQIQDIIDNNISNNKFHNSVKLKIDSGLYTILTDLMKLFYFRETPKCYNCNLLLHMTNENIEYELKNKKILGFQLYKNEVVDINIFTTFYNNQINIQFLNAKEKNILARIILQLEELKKILNNKNNYEELEIENKYALIDAYEMNSNNPKWSLILTEKLHGNKWIVLDSGQFDIKIHKKLLNYHSIKDNSLKHVSNMIFGLMREINEWTRVTWVSFMLGESLFWSQNRD